MIAALVALAGAIVIALGGAIAAVLAMRGDLAKAASRIAAAGQLEHDAREEANRARAELAISEGKRTSLELALKEAAKAVADANARALRRGETIDELHNLLDQEHDPVAVHRRLRDLLAGPASGG